MRMSLALIATFHISVAVITNGDNRVPVASRLAESHFGWTHLLLSPLEAAEAQITFTMYLHQQGLDQLEAIFNQISDPASAAWGNFLSKKELDDMVFASKEAFLAVDQWLATAGAHSVLQRTADTVVIAMPVNTVAAAFDTSVGRFEQQSTGRSYFRVTGTASLPADVEQHVHMIAGLTELWERSPGKQQRVRRHRSSSMKGTSDDTDIKVTPKVLREHYGIPADEMNASPKNYQAIAAFDDWFSTEALFKFNEANSLPTPEITTMGTDCVAHPEGSKPCDAVESDLDVQYITAMGTGVKTLFHKMNESSWVLAFTESAASLDPLPFVFSISYGWAELKQCDIAFSVCDTLGYDAKAYVNRSNVGFQKLATMGVSVLVSDGDDGASSTSPDGSNPIDPSRWCGGSEWTCYPKTNSSCAELQLRSTSGDSKGKTCPWPIGAMSDRCEWMFLGDLYQDADIIKALQDANPSCALEIFYDGDYGVHLYSECTCDTMAPFLHSGKIDITSEPFEYNASARLFYADFPTASPYVTSVGATAFKSVDGVTINAEHTASIVDGAIITTGGGFSAHASRPDWQAEAVQAWVTGAPGVAKPPKGTYDPTKRAYPDVALNGHNYQVYLTKDEKSTSCPCEVDGVDGTSASSPAFAGMISLINGQLLASDKSTLGFLNPLLYTMAADSADTFNDITYGDNKCSRNFCMTYGFNATVGWDPVAGLGTPQYNKIKAYVLAKKGVIAHN